MVKKIGLTALILIIGFYAGSATTRYFETSNLWDNERNGLTDLNSLMKHDKSKRLGIAILTQENTYTVQSFDPNRVALKAEFILLDGKDKT